MSIQTQLNNQDISLLPRVSELIKKAEQHEKDQMTALALRETLNSHTPVADMDEDDIEEFEMWLIVDFADKSLFKSTIDEIAILDYSNDDALSQTVELSVTSALGNSDTFYVQLTDYEYRSDLGCWITTDDSNGDICIEDYAEFDINAVVAAAEEFARASLPKKHVRGDWYLIEDEIKEVFIAAKENHNFINSDTSSYMSRFNRDTFAEFDSEKEAIEYINEQF